MSTKVQRADPIFFLVLSPQFISMYQTSKSWLFSLLIQAGYMSNTSLHPIQHARTHARTHKHAHPPHEETTTIHRTADGNHCSIIAEKNVLLISGRQQFLHTALSTLRCSATLNLKALISRRITVRFLICDSANKNRL